MYAHVCAHTYAHMLRESRGEIGTGRWGDASLTGELTVELGQRKHAHSQRQGKHSGPMCREGCMAKRVASRYREKPLHE